MRPRSAGLVAGLLAVTAAACAAPAHAAAGRHLPFPGHLAPPRVAPAGMHRVYLATFARGRLGPPWNRYHGQPGSDPAGWWDPSHVVVTHRMLVLRTYRDPAHYGQASGTPWVEGGVDLHLATSQTYGEWLVRSRVTSTTGVTEVMILWPRANSWPPEIDFNESDGTNGSTATLHWGTASQDFQTQATVPRVNLRRWHTWGVRVTPAKIRFLLDGRVWATMANREHTAVDLAIQQQVWPCGRSEHCPSAATRPETDLEIAWVAEYAPGR